MRTPSIETRTYLRTLPLFQDLDADVLDRIAGGTRELRAAGGAYVFRRGDPCRGFHAVVHGRVKLAASASDGAEKVVEVVRSGQSFGRSLMFTDLTYPVHAQALVDTLLLHVDGDVVRGEIERTPKLATRMLTGLRRKVSGMLGDVEAWALQSGVQRVVGYLLRRAVPVPGEAPKARVVFDISRSHVASWLGLTPEHFARVLEDLGHEGLITVRGSEVVLDDPDRLRAIAFH